MAASLNLAISLRGNRILVWTLFTAEQGCGYGRFA